MEKFIERITQEYNFPPAVIDELTTIIEAWEGIGMSEKEIKEELQQYKINLK